jgi:hypothetical protein
MHYPGMVTPASAMEVVNRTGKPVFASEDYGVYFDASGGKAWARLLNQNAVRGYMSGTIAWNLGETRSLFFFPLVSVRKTMLQDWLRTNVQKIDYIYGVSRSLELLPALRGCLLRSQVKPTAADLCPPIFSWRRITCQDRLGTHKRKLIKHTAFVFAASRPIPTAYRFDSAA